MISLEQRVKSIFDSLGKQSFAHIDEFDRHILTSLIIREMEEAIKERLGFIKEQKYTNYIVQSKGEL